MWGKCMSTEVIQMDMDTLREQYLDPKIVLSMILAHVFTLLKLPVGAGKSWLVDRLLALPELYTHFDRVFYMSFQWDIIMDRPYAKNPDLAPVMTAVMEGRPKEDCGLDLDAEWKEYETSGCISLGRSKLCGNCPQNSDDKSCAWATSFSKRMGEAQLVFLTDQHLKTNPQLLLYFGGERTLLIADEARFSQASFKVQISKVELNAFIDILQSTKEIPEDIKTPWITNLNVLKKSSTKSLQTMELDFPQGLRNYQVIIQDRGLRRYPDFKYLGYLLVGFTWSLRNERWSDGVGGISFLYRPYLNHGKTLVLSADMPAEFIKNRLKIKEVYSPCENIRLAMPGTTVVNIVSSGGSKFNFKRNKKSDNHIRDDEKPGNHTYILKQCASLIIDNIEKNKSTLLVCKKDTKNFCAEKLARLLAEFNYAVAFITDNYTDNLRNPVSKVIPIIHYGMAGINLFSSYEICYCINSYNLDPDDISALFYDGMPEKDRPKIEIKKDENHYRAVVANSMTRSTRKALQQCLDVYERSIPYQAVGRCRPFNNPRKIILFQTHNYEPEFGEHYSEVATFGHLYEHLNLPTLDERKQLQRLNIYDDLIAQGMPSDEALKAVGVVKSTISKWRKKRLKFQK